LIISPAKTQRRKGWSRFVVSLCAFASLRERSFLQSDHTAVETPSFLDSADKARAYLNGLQDRAKSLGRYFSGTTTIANSTTSGMFTFIDGDCTLMSGSGFLVVTGTLTMRGNTDFKGVILVLGIQYDSSAFEHGYWIGGQRLRHP
jgi:hypothetical protein